MATWDGPVCQSLRPENQVIYLDPPARIGQAFGGRSWFLEMGIQRIHRIGLLKGLGWMLHADNHTDRINGVKIISTGPDTRVYRMTFGLYEMGDGNCDAPNMVMRAVFREKVKETLLKAVYQDVLGQQAV